MIKILFALLFILIICLIVKFVVRQSLKDIVNECIQRDSWRVAEMHCPMCGKHWVATYPREAINLECPSCHHMAKAPLSIMKWGDEIDSSKW